LSYKIQSKTILGWLDIVGVFPTIEEATEMIPKIEKIIMSPTPMSNIYILRIVDLNEISINESFLYDLNSIQQYK